MTSTTAWDLPALELQGRELAARNPRFAQFALMLSHPEFADFFAKNFATLDDCKMSLMMLKMGQTVQQSAPQPLSGNQLAAAMAHVVLESQSRHTMVDQTLKFVTDSVRAVECIEGGQATQYPQITHQA